MTDFHRNGDQLVWGERSVSCGEVMGFCERFSGWSARGWLEIRGPNWVLPIEVGYGENRRYLRSQFPDVPFESDWMDGRFPSMAFGIPPVWSLLLSVSVAAVLTAGIAWFLGGAGAVLFLMAWVWPLGHVRSQLVVQKGGVRAGAPWSGLTSWHHIEAATITSGTRAATIRVQGKNGGGECVVPVVLVPAIRARLWRIGGVTLREEPPGVLERYLRWFGPSWGLPWGILIGCAAAVWGASNPWTLLTIGVIIASAIGFLGASVRARALGWGGGGVLWLVALYSLGLVVLSLILGGWIVLP